MRSPAAVIERHARVIGVACGSGAQDHGCADGPEALRAFGFFRDLEAIPGRLRWDSTIRCAAESAGDSLAAVAKVADPLSRCVVRTLGARVYFMDEIRERGLPVVWREAVAHVCRNTAGYGISLDLDALDPTEEAGVGSPVPGGLHKPELLDALKSVHADSRLLALEIVEYNPHRDENFETAKAVHDLCLSLLG